MIFADCALEILHTRVKYLESERRAGKFCSKFFETSRLSKKINISKMTKKEIKSGKIKTGVMNYPIGDFLIRVKNAARAHKKVVIFTDSKFVRAIASLLKTQGYLDQLETNEGILKVGITHRHKEPVIMDIKLISKPGLRIYANYNDLAKKKNPSKIIISTPVGVMFSNEAIKKKMGGELIAEIL